MRQLSDVIIPAQAAATVNSAPIPAVNLFSISAQIVATGAAAGTMKLQASNDNPPNGPSAVTHWNDITGATVAVAAAGSFLIPKTDICYEYIRVVYTNTGTGTIMVTVKGLGA